MGGKTWVLVAESSRARVLSIDGHELKERYSLSHPEGRMHDTRLTTDLPGRTFDSAGQGGRHVKEPPTDPKRYEAQEFARQIGTRIDNERARNEFDKLYVMAPPHFLGLLRDNIPTETRNLIVGEVDKNLVQHELADILSHLPERP